MTKVKSIELVKKTKKLYTFRVNGKLWHVDTHNFAGWCFYRAGASIALFGTPVESK